MSDIKQGSKSKATSKKKQGDSVANPPHETSMHDIRSMRDPDMLKGSMNSNLGREKVDIDTKKYAHTLDSDKNLTLQAERSNDGPPKTSGKPNAKSGGKGSKYNYTK